MALKPCKECGREISTEAKTCPHCGKSSPTGAKTSPLAIGCLAIIIVGVFANVISSLSSSPGSQGTSAPSTGTSAQFQSTQPASSAPPEPGSQWHYAHDTDEMTGQPSHTATVLSDNTVEFDFPYHRPQRGRLMVRRHPRFGADVIFAIERGQLLCPSYDGCTVLVRFDEGQPSSFSASPPADNSSESIFIDNYERFVSRMLKARRVRVSPKVYQEGTVIFTFDVSAFDQKKFRNQ